MVYFPSAKCVMAGACSWSPVRESCRVGVVTYNYLPGWDSHVQAFIGDKIHLFEECKVADWT